MASSADIQHLGRGCDSVGGLQDRLGNVEGELSRLTVLLKTGSSLSAFEEEPSARSPADDQLSEDTAWRTPTDRHAVRSQNDLMDRYHGPCSLFALCNEFRDLILSEQRKRNTAQPEEGSHHSQKKQYTMNNDEAVQEVLARLCLEAGLEESFDLQSDQVPIRLPPKQFLLMAQTQFFQQADYTTDLFVHSSFWSNMEQLYSRPFKPGDEAWAICFNTIILLVLGSATPAQRGNQTLVGSQFALPFLLAVRTALSNPGVLMAPKLVNVQALALLGIASQLYYPTALSESIFAQACMLARTMGLHQTHITPEGINPEEAEERVKVFMSLYLRDKSFSISRGSLCWLPSFDCSLPSEPSQIAFADSTCIARIQLARLQEDIYQSFYSAGSQTQSPIKKKSAMSRIERQLKDWADANDVFGLPYTTIRHVDLQLEFLAASISAFRVSADPGHVHQALDSARASCMLLLISYGKYDHFMMKRLETFLLHDRPSRILSKTSRLLWGGSDEDAPSDPSTQSPNGSISSRPYNLLDTFSIPGIFALFKSVVCPGSTNTESRAEDDLDLLQKVYVCFQEFDARAQEIHGTAKIGRVLHELLELVNLIRKPSNSPMSIQRSNQTSNLRTSPTSQDSLGRALNVPEFSNMLASSPYPMPSLSWKGSSIKDASTPRTKMGVPPNLIAPMDSQYIPQTFEPFQQHSSSPHVQHQNMGPRSRKRPYENEPDLSLDNDPDMTPLSDFSVMAPEMSFNVMS